MALTFLSDVWTPCESIWWSRYSTDSWKNLHLSFWRRIPSSWSRLNTSSRFFRWAVSDYPVISTQQSALHHRYNYNLIKHAYKVHWTLGPPPLFWSLQSFLPEICKGAMYKDAPQTWMKWWDSNPGLLIHSQMLDYVSTAQIASNVHGCMSVEMIGTPGKCTNFSPWIFVMVY